MPRVPGFHSIASLISSLHAQSRHLISQPPPSGAAPDRTHNHLPEACPLLKTRQSERRFNRDIRPILSDKCFTCHGPDAANRKTKMRLDMESTAKIELRDKHWSIVGGDPEASEIYRRISSDNKAVRMPPAYLGRDKLKPHEIELVKEWIAEGAKWQPFWSFIPPQRPALPVIQQRDWPQNLIDNFILNRLEREGLHPSPKGDKRTLVRRVMLDLTGLPPTPLESQAFLDDLLTQNYQFRADRCR